MRALSKKSMVGVAAAAVVVAGSGVAWAYWTASGTGSQTASTAAAGAQVSITGATTLTAMYPGDAAQSFTATVTNTDPAQSAYVTVVRAHLTVAQAPGAVGTCDAGDYLLDGTAGADQAHPVTLHWTAQELAHGAAASTAGTDTIQFNDKSTTNQDGCKGATVTINYVAA